MIRDSDFHSTSTSAAAAAAVAAAEVEKILQVFINHQGYFPQ